LGDYKEIYLTWSERNIGSSGATIRSLLQYIAENTDIPIISLMKSSNPLLPQYKITHRESFKANEVSESFYVRFQTDPNDMGVIQDDLFASPDQSKSFRAVFVGLPCQVKAVKSQCPDIATIGLFCGGIHDQLALRLFLKRLKIKPEEVTKLTFRTSPNKNSPDDWMYFEALNRKPEDAFLVKRHTQSKTEKAFNSFFCGALHCEMCRHCTDTTAEYADISVGDAWAVGLGRNICIVRTEIGKWIVDEAVRLMYLRRETLSYEKVMESQHSLLVGKKLGLWNWPQTSEQTLEAIDDRARYWAQRYRPSFENIMRRRILRKAAGVRGIRMYIPEIDRLLSLFFSCAKRLLRIRMQIIQTLSPPRQRSEGSNR